MPRRKSYAAVFTLLLSNFLNVFGWALLTPLYALYATQLGASPEAVTFTWAFYTLLAGVLTIGFGWIEDKLGGKNRVLTFGYVIEAVGLGILVCAQHIPMLMVGLAVYAVGVGIVTPVWKLLFSRKEHKGKEAMEWGIFHGVNTLLISAAATVSGLMYAGFGFRGIIGLMVVMHFGAALVSLRNQPAR